MRMAARMIWLGAVVAAPLLVGCVSGSGMGGTVVDRDGGPADFDRSGMVDANDLLRLASAWLDEGPSFPQDMDCSGRVDLADLVQFAEDWRAGVTTDREPVVLTLGKRASWPPGHEGYDPNLPGWHIIGDIASVRLHARAGALPREFVLAIRTSPGMPPMLENFTLTTPRVQLSGEPFNPGAGMAYFRKTVCPGEWETVPETDADTYFKFEIRDDEVRVTFLPGAVELLRAGCAISWIDWYRR